MEGGAAAGGFEDDGGEGEVDAAVDPEGVRRVLFVDVVGDAEIGLSILGGLEIGAEDLCAAGVGAAGLGDVVPLGETGGERVTEVGEGEEVEDGCADLGDAGFGDQVAGELDVVVEGIADGDLAVVGVIGA